MLGKIFVLLTSLELVEGWEEVGRSGEGSAVGEGLLRERDALALLRALPLRQLLAKMALFNRSVGFVIPSFPFQEQFWCIA